MLPIKIAKKRYFVAVEVSSTYLKVVVMDEADKKILTAAVKDISSVNNQDIKGKVIVNLLNEIIPRDVIKSSTGLLCLADEPLQIKRLELPHMPVEEFRDALKWRVKGIIPFDADKSVLDYDILGELQDEDGAKKTDIIMAITPREGVDEKVSYVKESGIDIVTYASIKPFVITNLLKLLPEVKKEDACAVLDIGHKESTVGIYRDNKLRFVRNIPVGLNHIKQSIKGPVISDKGPIELTSDDMERLRSIGIPDNEELLLDGKIQGKHLMFMLRPVAESLCKEVGRSFDYYNAQLEGGHISKIHIMGDGSNYKNIDKFIGEILNTETEYIGLPDSLKESVPDNIKTDGMMPLIAALIATALGAPESKVNLLPMDYRVEKSQRIQKISIRIAGITTTAILITSFLMVNLQISNYKQLLATAKSHKKIIDEVREVYDRTIERERFVSAVRNSEVPTISIMKELSNIIPPKILLSSLIIEQRTKAIGLQGVLYLGANVAEVVLADFMDELERSPFFSNAVLETSRKDIYEDRNVAIFAIKCAIQK